MRQGQQAAELQLILRQALSARPTARLLLSLRRLNSCRIWAWAAALSSRHQLAMQGMSTGSYVSSRGCSSYGKHRAVC